MREQAIEQYLVQEVKKRKGMCIKLTGLGGIPDRMILLPVRIVVFAETKTAIGKLSPLQKVWQKALIKLGFACIVIRSKAEVIHFLSQYDKLQNN